MNYRFLKPGTISLGSDISCLQNFVSVLRSFEDATFLLGAEGRPTIKKVDVFISGVVKEQTEYIESL